MRRLSLILLLAVTPIALLASDHFWLIGGGPVPAASEAQIEFNVAWVRESIRRMVPDATIHVFFANGDGEEAAAIEHLVEPGEEAVRFEPLARVFGQFDENRLQYRQHEITNLDGGTAAADLVPRLEQQLSDLRPGDQGMIVFNGHGSWDSDHSRNALRLWGESRLDVREFERLLSKVDPEVPIRFVFTQCFSGAFERAVYPGASTVLDLAEGQRCGFFAESEDRLSEGCSASIEVGDYRDYTTYFFAALTGETRLGEAVTERRDWDGDGEITPFDAHLHTIVEGRNADLPRSTSEAFLERWQPWYLRWLSAEELPRNVYGRAARTLAEVVELPTDGRALGAALEARYDQVTDRIRRSTEEQHEVRARMRIVQDTIQEALSRRWPQVLAPFTAGYAGAVATDLETMTSMITTHPAYADLVRLQEQEEALTVKLIELDRDLSHLEKLRRTRMLARALADIERHGSDEDRAAYDRLRVCETLPLQSP